MTKSPLELFRKESGLSRNELASLGIEDDPKLKTQMSQAIARCEAGLEGTDHYCLNLIWLKLKEQCIDLEQKQRVWLEQKRASRGATNAIIGVKLPNPPFKYIVPHEEQPNGC